MSRNYRLPEMPSHMVDSLPGYPENAVARHADALGTTAKLSFSLREPPALLTRLHPALHKHQDWEAITQADRLWYMLTLAQGDESDPHNYPPNTLVPLEGVRRRTSFAHQRYE